MQFDTNLYARHFRQQPISHRIWTLKMFVVVAVMFFAMEASTTLASPAHEYLRPDPAALVIGENNSYGCTVIIVADDLVYEKDFTAVNRGGTHGGEEYTFREGNHEVTLLADGKWQGISWWHKGQLISESISVLQTTYSQSRVMIAYNPKNTGEQVSVNCQIKSESSQL